MITVIKDLGAYIILFIIYYTLRLFKAPFWWIPLDDFGFWGISEKLMSTDIMMFIAIVTVGLLWIFTGIVWMLIGVCTLVGLLLLASGLFWLRKKWRNRKKN